MNPPVCAYALHAAAIGMTSTWLLASMIDILGPLLRLPATLRDAAGHVVRAVRPLAAAGYVVRASWERAVDGNRFDAALFSLLAALLLWTWWIDKDDPWKRRGRRALSRVKQVGQRLVVVPEGARSDGQRGPYARCWCRLTYLRRSSVMTCGSDSPRARAVASAAAHTSSGTRTERRGVCVERGSATSDGPRAEALAAGGAGQRGVRRADEAVGLGGADPLGCGPGDAGRQPAADGAGAGDDVGGGGRGLCHDTNCTPCHDMTQVPPGSRRP